MIDSQPSLLPPSLLPEQVRPFWDALNPYQQRAAALVVILNAAASSQFKSRYARRWWNMLEERVKLCAMTSGDLLRWSSAMTARLGGGDVARNAEHREAWRTVVSGPHETLVLDALQYDAPVLVALCRAISEARREHWEAEVVAEREPESLTEEQTALL